MSKFMHRALLFHRRQCLHSTSFVRQPRYETFDAHLDPDLLAEARKWRGDFDPSNLPQGATTYARSSGPGGQHVNKTETKAVSVFHIHELKAILPKFLHSSLYASKYYVAGSDALCFHAQTHRSRTSNKEENHSKLVAEILRIYQDNVPDETSIEKKEKYKQV